MAVPTGTLPSTTNILEKSILPKIAPTMGMIRSFTIESTILPNAAPMITPTARSITLPLRANSLNSDIMLMGFSGNCGEAAKGWRLGRIIPAHGAAGT